MLNITLNVNEILSDTDVEVTSNDIEFVTELVR